MAYTILLVYRFIFAISFQNAHLSVHILRGVDVVEVSVEVSEVMVLSIWYPVGEGGRFDGCRGAYTERSSGRMYTCLREINCNRRCANEKFAYEGVKKPQNVQDNFMKFLWGELGELN